MLHRLFLLLCVPCVLVAHEPITTKLTWSKEISRIVYKRCANCHYPNGRAMSLLDYTEARPWAKAIRDEVLARRMPPWGAVKGFGDLQPDPSLTQEEINRIAQWVEGGAPEGDAKFLPPRPGITLDVPLPRGRRIPLPSRVTRPLTLLALEPVADVADARITATLPDGRVEPLLWLHDYKAKWKLIFRFAEPLRLPSGSIVTIEPRVPVRAFTSAPIRGR